MMSDGRYSSHTCFRTWFADSPSISNGMITTSNCHFWEDHRLIDSIAPAWLVGALGSCLSGIPSTLARMIVAFSVIFFFLKGKKYELEATGSDFVLF